MLARAYAEGLVKNKPEDVVHFVPSAEEAVRWIEMKKEQSKGQVVPKVKTRASLLKRSSFFSPPVLSRSISWFSSDNISEGGIGKFFQENRGSVMVGTIGFVAGVSIGFLSGRRQQN